MKQNEDAELSVRERLPQQMSSVQNPGWLMIIGIIGDYATQYTQMLQLTQWVTALALCARCISRTRTCQKMPSM